MKLRIEISDALSEPEVIIRCAEIDGVIQKLEAYVRELNVVKLIFYKGAQEYFIPLDAIIFFETDQEKVYAHTAKDSYRVKYRLYELDTMLPANFVRIAKSAIANTARIYSINRSLTSPYQIKFTGSRKHIYVSRHYYGALKNKMNDRSA